MSIRPVKEANAARPMIEGAGVKLHRAFGFGDTAEVDPFLLWANLPAARKMTAPRYEDIVGRDIPEVTDDDGTHVRVVCGEFWGKRGPVERIAADPRYLDVWVPPGHRKRLAVETFRHAFAYVFEGGG